MKFFKQLMTGPDNETYELAHFIWLAGALGVIGVAAYSAFKSGTYPSGFGTDFGAVSAGGAAGAYARAKADQTKDIDPGVDK